MHLWAFVIGFMVALFPVIAMMALFKGRFLWINHPYMKGALMGFLTWIAAGLIMHFDLKYNVIGFMHKASSGSLLALYPEAHFGFITSGLAVAYFRDTMDILKKKQQEKK